jgi:hypothetical protein
MKAGTQKTGVLDEYDRNARLKPVLLMVLPVSLLIVTLGAAYSTAVSVLAAPLTAMGFAYIMAQFARDWGKQKQPHLFALWGGCPTTAKLRHRDTTLNPHTRARYHEFSSRLIGKPLPTIQEEQADPEAADAIYESVGDRLREETRDKREFPLVFAELTSYGFRRNLWGMKRFGIVVAILAVSGQTIILAADAVAGRSIAPIPAIATVANILLLLVWIIVVTPSWVKTAADGYAERLLATRDALDLVAQAKKVPKRGASPKAKGATR